MFVRPIFGKEAQGRKYQDSHGDEEDQKSKLLVGVFGRVGKCLEAGGVPGQLEHSDDASNPENLRNNIISRENLQFGEFYVSIMNTWTIRLTLSKPADSPELVSSTITEMKYGMMEKTSIMFMTPLTNSHFLGAP